MPRSSALYSATLLVATPIASPRSTRTSPDSSPATAAIAAGPGFPRAPPSTLTRTSSGNRRSEAHPPVLGRRRVPLPRGAVQLVHLVALVDLVDLTGLVLEIDAPLIPGELPGDRDADLTGRAGGGPDRDRRQPECAGEASDGARVLGGVEAGHSALEPRRRALRRRRAPPQSGARC